MRFRIANIYTCIALIVFILYFTVLSYTVFQTTFQSETIFQTTDSEIQTQIRRNVLDSYNKNVLLNDSLFTLKLSKYIYNNFKCRSYYYQYVYNTTEIFHTGHVLASEKTPKLYNFSSGNKILTYNDVHNNYLKFYSTMLNISSIPKSPFLDVPIFIINLDRSIDRYNKMYNVIYHNFNHKNIHRVRAIDGLKMNRLTRHYSGTNERLYVKMNTSSGDILDTFTNRPKYENQHAVLISHLLGVLRGYQSGQYMFMIFEDDLNFDLLYINTPCDTLEHILNEANSLYPNWGIIQLSNVALDRSDNREHGGQHHTNILSQLHANYQQGRLTTPRKWKYPENQKFPIGASAMAYMVSRQYAKALLMLYAPIDIIHDWTLDIIEWDIRDCLDCSDYTIYDFCGSVNRFFMKELNITIYNQIESTNDLLISTYNPNRTKLPFVNLMANKPIIIADVLSGSDREGFSGPPHRFVFDCTKYVVETLYGAVDLAMSKYLPITPIHWFTKWFGYVFN